MAPGAGSHSVVVLDLSAGDFIPLWALGVEVVNIESVEVTNYDSLTSGVKSSTGEFLDTLVL